MWILEKNFPKKLLCIEGKNHAQRITCDDVKPYLSNNAYQAISSHLLTLPEPCNEIGLLHISMIRHPIKRLYSAYQFQLKTQLIASHISFHQYCEKTLDFQGNFQSKHSSLQPAHSWQKHKGWLVDLSSIDLNRTGLFFGLVELFDESMVVLEHLMQQKGIAFDASYHKKVNASDTAQINTIDAQTMALLDTGIGDDLALYTQVEKKLLALFTQIDPHKEKLALFKQRCAAIDNSKRIRPPINSQWIRIIKNN